MDSASQKSKHGEKGGSDKELPREVGENEKKLYECMAGWAKNGRAPFAMFAVNSEFRGVFRCAVVSRYFRR